MVEYQTDKYILHSYHGIQNDAFQHSKLHVSLVGPCSTSVRYKGILLCEPLCTQITPEVTRHHRHSTLESVANIHSHTPQPQAIKERHSFLHRTEFQHTLINTICHIYSIYVYILYTHYVMSPWLHLSSHLT